MVIEQGQCRFLSRKKHKLTGHQDLSSGIGARGECGVLDGELVVVDHLGRSVFADMVQWRHPARDLLSLDGEDLTYLPFLAKGKIETNLAVPLSPCPLCRPSRDNGTALYRLACQLDLEGIVTKRADSPYEDVLTCGIGSKSRIPPSAKRKGGRICSSEQACNRCHSQIACAGIWAVL